MRVNFEMCYKARFVGQANRWDEFHMETDCEQSPSGELVSLIFAQ